MIGVIQDVPAGSVFPMRVALSRAGVHRPPMGGICGTVTNGAAEFFQWV